MSFNSLAYLLYLLTVVAVYWLLPFRFQNIFLLAASYFFLGFVHPWFTLLILGVSTVNYLAALAMERWPRQRKTALLLAVAISLFILATFKYANFFLANLNLLLEKLGAATFFPVLSIMLPVGISFYTFQSLAYTVDVFRGEVKPRRNFIDFTLFISFFPQLVAGPIERSRDLMPQVIRPRRVTPEMINHGLLLLLWGFFKKLVIADNAGLLTYKVFSLTDPGFYLVWAGVYSFAIQILADFWSYTDIARGSALLLGFRLSRNFDHPYFSVSPSDFWRRWHMSLSYWLRDYLYIPLGGSRCSRPRASFNILVTFLLSGLWHGASWNFVLWGGYHGLLVLCHRFVKQMTRGWNAAAGISRWLTPVRIGFTFVLVCVGWLLFRVTDLHRLGQYLRLSPFQPGNDLEPGLVLLGLALLYSLPIWIHGLAHLYRQRHWPDNQPLPRSLLMARPLLMALLFLGILLLRSPEPSTFIYFQF